MSYFCGKESGPRMPCHVAPIRGAAPMKTTLAVLAGFTLFLPSFRTATAVSTYLSIPSITGEDPVPGYPGAMVVRSLTLTPDNFSIIKNIDSATPAISTDVITAKLLGTASLLFYNAAPTATPDLVLPFPNTLASARQTLTTTPLTESVSFNSSAYAALFMEIPGITGESATPGHPNVIQLDSFTLTPTTFSITKPIDLTSPHLQSAVILATQFPTATLLLYTTSGSEPQPDAELLFSSNIAASYQVLGGPGTIPDDQTTFAFNTFSPEPATSLLLLPALSLLLLRR